MFVLAYVETEARVMNGTERLLALDEETGEVLWTHEWATTYRMLMFTYATGPRATPTVDGDRVYVLGAAGVLHALNVETGEVLWQRNYVEEYGTEIPSWGLTGAPLVDDDRLIALVGGQPDAKVVAFDKMTEAAGTAPRSSSARGAIDNVIMPIAFFALWAMRRMYERGTKPEHLARIAAKNWNNGALTPGSHRQSDHIG